LLLLAIALTAGIVIAAVVVAMVPVTFWLGLLIVGAFGWATYPRSGKGKVAK
jgi:ABC-type dipeptide/oligopeptide/nickel transport system permease subunit